MKKEKPHCLVCKHIRHTKPDKEGTQLSFCILCNEVVPKEDLYEKVNCNSYQRIPVTCASCGDDIIGGKKASNPLRYRSGKNKGKVKPCCDNPDWRVCPNRDCEAEGALICKNCGYYWGDITW